MIEFIALLSLAAIILTILLFYFLKKNSELKILLEQQDFEKASQRVKYGKLSEQWIPLSERFPYNSHTFRFLGNPIDGIAFEEDKIVFCEFKTGNSKLNERQKNIKKLVEEKKIEWFESSTKA